MTSRPGPALYFDENIGLNALLVQVAHFQKESSALAVGRRRLASDRKRLTDEVTVTDMIIT